MANRSGRNYFAAPVMASTAAPVATAASAETAPVEDVDVVAAPHEARAAADRARAIRDLADMGTMVTGKKTLLKKRSHYRAKPPSATRTALTNVFFVG